MSISKDDALLNFINTLDRFLGAMKIRVDNNDTTSVIQMLNVLEKQIFGKDISIFTKGVIFGLQATQVKNIGETWGLEFGPVIPDDSLIRTENLNDWVITRGTLFDGTSIKNIEPLSDKVYAYKINPIINASMVDFLIPGYVVYSNLDNTFHTHLNGQVNSNYPVNAVLKTGIDSTSYAQNLASYDYFNAITENITITEILICRFILEVIGTNDYTLTILNDRNLYSFQYGQPYFTFLNFAYNTFKCIRDALTTGYDVTIVQELVYYIVNAEIWEPDFATYWTTGGRTLPDNVKYYYNEIFEPNIA